jgi:Protein of unknown function (DUF3667)
MLGPDRCANCDRAIDGADQKFCPACGQPVPAHRIDWHFLGHELEHSVLHMDRGIFYSLKHLMLRPGHFIRDYIEGRRAHHVKPMLLIMILAALMVFLAKYLLGGDLIGTGLSSSAATSAGGNADGTLDPARLLVAFESVKEWMNRNYTATTLLLLPLEAGAFKLVFRRIGGLNYPEWLVIVTYLTAQTFVIMALSVPLEHWYPQVRVWSLSLATLYSIFTLVQYFKDYPRWKAALRGAFGFALFSLASFVVSLVLMVVVFA